MADDHPFQDLKKDAETLGHPQVRLVLAGR